MKSKKITALLLLVLLLLGSVSAVFQIQQSPFEIAICEQECNNLLDPSSQVEDVSEQIKLLVEEVLSGDITLRAFVQRLGRSHPRIVYSIINNHRFFAQNILYTNFFQFKYQTQLGQALKKNGFSKCPRTGKSTLYPKFESNRRGIPVYRNISDQLNYRPPAYSSTDGFWSYSHRLYNANFQTLREADQRFAFAPLLGLAQQAHCFIELYKQFDRSTRTIIFPPSDIQIDPGFFEHWAHLDSSLDSVAILEAARREIAEWLPRLSIADLYNFISMLTFIAFQTDVIEIMETCQSAIFDVDCQLQARKNLLTVQQP